MNNLKAIVECLLFLSEAPITIRKLQEMIPEAKGREIQSAVDELERDYQADGRGIMLKLVAQGYQIRSRPEFREYVKRLKKYQPVRLSRASLETLAIIAYKQPILKSEIERFRGVEVSGVLRLLLEKELIRIVGRKNLPGRPILYGTSRKFLELFDLKDLSSLPTLREFDQWIGEQDHGTGENP